MGRFARLRKPTNAAVRATAQTDERGGSHSGAVLSGKSEQATAVLFALYDQADWVDWRFFASSNDYERPARPRVRDPRHA
ncbi:hypothetical protein, partial [Achromobacter xylosoxidans]|uniref:hypothetical protein n=1 Tax=Alcaligenes xylosoxydans xylosoxydans TaxID=85698 RepID=UPI001F144FAE